MSAQNYFSINGSSRLRTLHCSEALSVAKAFLEEVLIQYSTILIHLIQYCTPLCYFESLTCFSLSTEDLQSGTFVVLLSLA